MPDIRFVPPALLFCILGVATVGERIARRDLPLSRDPEDVPWFPPTTTNGRRRVDGRLRTATAPARSRMNVVPAIAVLAFIAGCALVSRYISPNAPGWFAWNYSGYEAKSQWPAMQWLSTELSGDTGSGRVLWEKQDQRDNVDFGSERAFENMELFTGRPSTEGIHYGSSFMARASTYLQSSYSLNPVDPEAERIYSIIDPASWRTRFEQVNAREIITHSQEITAAFRSQRRFRETGSFGKFTVFEYMDFPDSYVEILAARRLSVVKAGPGGLKTDYYRFFRDYALSDIPFVSNVQIDATLFKLVSESGGIVAGSYDVYRDTAAAEAALGIREKGTAVKVGEEYIDDLSIRFSTPSPGQPHVVKVSYAPGWKSRSGEKIYPVAPGFMLIVPRSGNVELYYSRTAWELAGAGISLSMPLLLLILSSVAKTGMRRWRSVLTLGFAVFVATAFFLTALVFTGPAALARDIGTARTLDLSIPGYRVKAMDLVDKWANRETLEKNDNMLGFDAWRIKAEILTQEGLTREAAEIFAMLRARYPHSRVLSLLPSTT